MGVALPSQFYNFKFQEIMQNRGPAFLGALAANPKSVMACLFGFGLIPLIISAVFCGVYWDMWADAQENNDDFPDLPDGRLAFDTCGGTADLDTKWTTLLAFNSILYLILSILTLLIMLGYFLAPLMYVGGIAHSCGCCAHLAAIICTGVWRYSDDGKKCADITEAAVKACDNVDCGDDEPKDFGARIAGLFISQCVLFCFYNCCVSSLFQVSMTYAMFKKAQQM